MGNTRTKKEHTHNFNPFHCAWRKIFNLVRLQIKNDNINHLRFCLGSKSEIGRRPLVTTLPSVGTKKGRITNIMRN